MSVMRGRPIGLCFVRASSAGGCLPSGHVERAIMGGGLQSHKGGLFHQGCMVSGRGSLSPTSSDRDVHYKSLTASVNQVSGRTPPLVVCAGCVRIPSAVRMLRSKTNVTVTEIPYMATRSFSHWGGEGECAHTVVLSSLGLSLHAPFLGLSAHALC